MAVKNILFCTDFSENSVPARQMAVECAQVFQADLAILHVVDMWAGFPAYEDRVPIDVQELVRRTEEAVASDLESLANELGRTLGEVKTYSGIGIPAREIVRLAEEEGMDLIVMGTHGWTGFKHMLLGSVAENVLRTAKCPVLIVRSSAQ